MEWVTSKVVVSIAALVILASVGGFLALQREAWKDEGLSQAAGAIASAINDVSSINSEASVTISFEDGGGGLHVSGRIDGERYTVEITRDRVRCSLDDKARWKDLYGLVHLFHPSAANLTNASEVRALDDGHQKMSMRSTGSIQILRVLVGESDGHYETFIVRGG